MAVKTRRGTTSARDRLRNAAIQMFHHQGIGGTTLADIAQAADVPLGNVYYHFRTKEALIETVIEARTQELRDQFQAASLDPDPLERLKMLVRDARRNQADLVEHGCPFTAMTHDLAKFSTRENHQAGTLFEMFLDFATTQFQALGTGDDSRELAEDFISTLQGSLLLANSIHSTRLLERQLDRLELWLERVITDEASLS
jgi:TetR/AcrR family transcriptional regulator, transcriptional repressor for nem operon